MAKTYDLENVKVFCSPKIRSYVLHIFALGCFNLISVASLQAVALGIDFTPQVTKSSLKELDQLLKQNNIKTNSIQDEQLEQIFRARTSAHRARLSEVFLQLSKDPNFTKRFPEFAPLVKDQTGTIKALLQHDVGKSMKQIQPALDILKKMQGYDWRNPPPGVSAEQHEKISRLLKNAISDINSADKSAMQSIYNKLNRGSTWTGAHKDLTEVLDFYDTYKSRQTEIANNGRKLASPSEWIGRLENEGAYSEEELKRNPNKIKFAKYIEEVDPLKDNWKFSTTEHFIKEKASNPIKSVDKLFAAKGKQLLSETHSAGFNLAKKTMTSAIKGTVAVSGAFVVGKYLISPEEVSVQSIIADAAGSTENGTCDTVQCSKFVNDCAKLLKLAANTPLQEILSSPGVERCYQDFFNKPLDEQSQLRKDSNLDRLMNKYSPWVTQLRCEQDGRLAQVETRNADRVDSQTLSYSDSAELKYILRKTDDGEDRINTGTKLLSHCKNKICENYEMKEVLDSKLYFASGLRYPVDAFKWAKSQTLIENNQADDIYKCCQSSKCQNYFSEWTAKYNEIKKKVTTAK